MRFVRRKSVLIEGKKAKLSVGELLNWLMCDIVYRIQAHAIKEVLEATSITRVDKDRNRKSLLSVENQQNRFALC